MKFLSSNRDLNPLSKISEKLPLSIRLPLRDHFPTIAVRAPMCRCCRYKQRACPAGIRTSVDPYGMFPLDIEIVELEKAVERIASRSQNPGWRILPPAARTLLGGCRFHAEQCVIQQCTPQPVINPPRIVPEPPEI